MGEKRPDDHKRHTIVLYVVAVALLLPLSYSHTFQKPINGSVAVEALIEEKAASMLGLGYSHETLKCQLKGGRVNEERRGGGMHLGGSDGQEAGRLLASETAVTASEAAADRVCVFARETPGRGLSAAGPRNAMRRLLP